MNKPQILIVEDDNAVANLIAATLETQDYTYKRAGNGTEAVMQALSCKPDVMLLDLGLPDMDGVEIIKKNTLMEQYAHNRGVGAQRGFRQGLGS